MTTPAAITVRPVESADEQPWRILFRGYRQFYKLPESEDIVSTVWGWLMDPDHESQGLVVKSADEIVAIGNYRTFSRPTVGSTGLWLDDLFTKPAARGQGAARAVIQHLTEIAAARGHTTVRWITAEDNQQAQELYDKVATRTHWVTYDAAPAHGQEEI